MKIAVLGSLTKDHILIQSREEEYHQVGGGVYYASRALASLGVHVISIPLLAKKDADLLESLKGSDIQTFPQWTQQTTAYQNTYASNSLDDCEKKILDRVNGFHLSKKVVDAISNCDAIHLAPLSSEELSSSFFKELREEYSGKISLDGQGFTQGTLPNIREVLKGSVDIIKCDDSEVLKITGCGDEASAVQELESWEMNEIIVTRASRGSTLYFGEQRVDVEAVQPNKIVDATGCGDAYAAGYLNQRIQGRGHEESAIFASKIASENLEIRGALKRGQSPFQITY